MVMLEAMALALALTGANDTVLLDFSAKWCQPCRAMQPTVDRLVRDGYHVQQVDVDQQPSLAKKFRVSALPTFVMLVNGREVDRIVGASDYDRLRDLFPLRPAALTESKAQVRGQSPDSEVASRSSTSNTVARTRAVRATVRIRVDDLQGQSIGTGTIVDTHGDEALVLTCGHIFRDSHGRGRVQVELFEQTQPQAVPAKLLSYDLERDIALVSIVPGRPVEPVHIGAAGYGFSRGNSVFSVGCDRGDVPSLRESRITTIDRYLGPPNIEAAGEPTIGRSGGGLFSSEGVLIGVCNHADPRDDEGIYASLPTIHWALDRVGQRRVYDRATQQIASASRAEPRRDPSTQPLVAINNPPPLLRQIAVRGAPSSPADDAEVICIVRSRSDPQGGETVYVLDRPSREFLDRIARESRSGLAVQDTRVTDAPLLPRPRRPVVRAQSKQ